MTISLTTTEACANVRFSVLKALKFLVKKVDEEKILAIVAHANAANSAWVKRDASKVGMLSKTMSPDDLTFDLADNALVKSIGECIGDGLRGFCVSRRPYLRGNLGPNYVDGTELNIVSTDLNTTISNALEAVRFIDENADLVMLRLMSARAGEQEDTAKLHAMFSLINEEALKRTSESRPDYYAGHLRALGCDFNPLCQTWNEETGKAMFSVPVLHCQLFFAVNCPEALFAAFRNSEEKSSIILRGLTVYADLLNKNVQTMLEQGYRKAFVCVESIAMCEKDGKQDAKPEQEPTAADCTATPQKTDVVAPPAVIRKGVRVDWPSEKVQRRLDMSEAMETSVHGLIADEKIEELEELEEPEPKRARTAPPSVLSVPPPPCKPASVAQQRRGDARALTF